MSRPKKGASAISLRLFLVFLMLLGAGLMATGFAFSYGELSKYAVEVSEKKAEATASTNGDSQRIRDALRKELDANQEAQARISKLKSTNDFPQFEAKHNVEALAKRHNLAITSIDFSGVAGTSGDTSAQQPSQTPAPQTSTQKNSDVIVTFAESVSYRSFINFLRDVENALPKLQVSGVSISAGSSADTIKIEPLTIHMYTN